MTQYSLSEICRIIQISIEGFAPDSYWVTAEINSLSVRSGHCYMELIEKAENGQITAKVRATCWANNYGYLSQVFLHETGKPLSVGMKILTQVSIRFHAVYGLSLQIEDINPAFTIGNLAIERQQNIKRLEEQGLMQRQKEIPMPTIINRIAVISSQDAAGYGDFIHQLSSNSSHFRFLLELFPAIVQGERAESSIIEQLSEISRREQEFDCVVIIRGGGASSDLGCFDSYLLASHIALCPLPVITGIGHFRDLTIADMVAAESLKTPTAVAEWLIERKQIQLNQITDLQQQLVLAIQRHLPKLQQRLEHEVGNLTLASQHFLQRQQQALLMYDRTWQLLSPEQIYRRGYSLTTLNGKILHGATDTKKGDIIKTEWIDTSLISVVQ